MFIIHYPLVEETDIHTYVYLIIIYILEMYMCVCVHVCVYVYMCIYMFIIVHTQSLREYSRKLTEIAFARGTSGAR